MTGIRFSLLFAVSVWSLFAAQPPHVEWLAVVVVVRLRFLHAADFAGLSDDDASAHPILRMFRARNFSGFSRRKRARRAFS
jgi:hypothetical protein